MALWLGNFGGTRGQAAENKFQHWIKSLHLYMSSCQHRDWPLSTNSFFHLHHQIPHTQANIFLRTLPYFLPEDWLPQSGILDGEYEGCGVWRRMSFLCNFLTIQKRWPQEFLCIPSSQCLSMRQCVLKSGVHGAPSFTYMCLITSHLALWALISLWWLGTISQG